MTELSFARKRLALAVDGGLWQPRVLMWLALPLLLLVPQLSGGFTLSLLNQMGIAVVYALSYNLLLGSTGLLSFGHAVYFGMGGFFALHALRLIQSHGLPVPSPLLPLAGAAGGLLFGVVFGWLATRRAGTTFAMITLGLGELVVACTLILRSFFGGEEGINGDRVVDTQLPGLSMGPQGDVYYVILAWMLVAIALMRFIGGTPLGRMANAARDNAERVEFVGYSVRRVRFLMFALAGLFAGLAGGLHALNYEIITAEALGANTSARALLMAYIGGIGHFAGPIFGAVVVTLLEIVLAGVTDAWPFYLGALFMLVVLFAPGGLAGLVYGHAPIARSGRLHRLAVPYALTLPPLLTALLGAVVVIEVNYHARLYGAMDPVKTMFGVPVDTGSPWPLLAGLALLVIGGLVLRPAARQAARRHAELIAGSAHP